MTGGLWSAEESVAWRLSTERPLRIHLDEGVLTEWVLYSAGPVPYPCGVPVIGRATVTFDPREDEPVIRSRGGIPVDSPAFRRILLDVVRDGTS